ncbi:antibiotic biosynthesis monooxygenase [Pseudomonas alloputida]|jgi:quinol monooxygenase YgiN|uniref:Antibiotic biosynthesis monooxygenase n=3 Tax=Pseudomonas TaxID=286 RepID=I7C1B6_PSEPT|nr:MULTISPECIES: putative quinol monooxygenase [Pseudomonas]AFO46856.1 antibiotic biosynthesis monooxygenase [Pseudomonas putida DOT-T1E]EKT4478611.1 antibiotic biosynthesis monooxygenase [Pseudomonas putida]MDD2148837.1 antibiotic biosynthesis monooxygenase [Pseudomonas putida]NWL44651.1 antibiotic biosynthesis monooxygenase [Pseudomonas hunanensis]PTV54433.1 antibiotic biosynthesis monooxygenase [Pseudomonas putida]
MLTKLAFFTARPGQSGALGQRLLALVGPTRQEPGCVRYDIYQSGDSVEGWLVYEDWHSSEAFDGHLQTPYVQAFMTELDTFCSEVPEVHTFERRA